MDRVPDWKHAKAYAWGNLAVSFWAHLFRKLAPKRGAQGKAAFLAHYADDAIVPFTAAELAALPDLERCITCRLCDAGCPTLGADGAFPGPSTMMRSLSRDPTYFALVDEIPCGECRACEPLCPTQVPIRTVLRMVESKQQSLKSL